MLTFDRRIGESIVLFVDDKEIKITLTKIGSNQAWLSFGADDTVKIWRDELLEDSIA